MAALPSTQEMQAHALSSETEEESIFPADEARTRFVHNLMATLHTTSWPILTHSQESSRLPPQDAAAEEVPGPEQLIKLSMTIGYAGCRPTSCSHASHSRAHTDDRTRAHWPRKCATALRTH